MQPFLAWLATSPLATAAKIASGALMVWVIDNVTTLGLPAWAQVAIIAGFPVLVNAVNPADPRYGRVTITEPME